MYFKTFAEIFKMEPEQLLLANRHCQIFIRVCCAFIIFLSLAGVFVFPEIIRNQPKFLTTISLIFSALSLLILTKKSIPRSWRILTISCNIIVLIIALLALCQHLLCFYFWRKGIHVINMEFSSALYFIFFSIALLLIDAKKVPQWSYQLCIFLLIPLLLAIFLLHAFHVSFTKGLIGQLQLDIPTLIAMAVLFFALLLIRSHIGIVKILLEKSISGSFARRELFMILFVPISIMFLLDYALINRTYAGTLKNILTNIFFMMTLLIIVSINILTIKRNEKFLKNLKIEITEHNNLISEFAEYTNSVFWRVDLLSNITTYVSPSYEKIWGRSTALLFKNSNDWLEAVIPNDKDKMLDSWNRRNSNSADSIIDFSIVKPDGKIRKISTNLFYTYDDNKKAIEMLGISTDITDASDIPSFK